MVWLRVIILTLLSCNLFAVDFSKQELEYINFLDLDNDKFISIQEIKSGGLVYASDVVVCDAFHDQRNPRIDVLTDSGEVSYLIYWEDMRSSGKEDLTNLFSQQLKLHDCDGSLGGSQGFPSGTCNCSGALPNEGYDCNGIWLNNDVSLPMEFKLYDNFPNPFNPTTNIMFDVPKVDFIEITIYNINGQKVKDLHSGYFAPGQHSVLWNGTDNYGGTVASGVYFYSMKATGFDRKNKMVLIK